MKRIPFALLIGCLPLAAAVPAGAVWNFQRVDAFEDPNYRFNQGEFVYQKNQDVMHFDLASGAKTSVTGNGALVLDEPIWVEDRQVWYVSSLPVASPVYHLMRFRLDSGEHELLYTSREEISPYHVESYAGHLVLMIAGDWWVWDGLDMEQVTFSGFSLAKTNPVLSGYHLLWVGEQTVYHTFLPTRETRAVGAGRAEDRSLRAAGAHAAWMESAPAGQSGYRIRLMPLNTLESASVDSSLDTAGRPIRFQDPYMIYTRNDADGWSIRRLWPLSPHPEPLYTSSLQLTAPFVQGAGLFFVARNCPDGSCNELCRHDLVSGATDQLTTFGQGSFVNDYEVAGGRVAFVRNNLWISDLFFELYAGQEEPGPACGTALPAGPGRRPANLLMLLLPLIAARAARRRWRRGDAGPGAATPRIPRQA